MFPTPGCSWQHFYKVPFQLCLFVLYLIPYFLPKYLNDYVLFSGNASVVAQQPVTALGLEVGLWLGDTEPSGSDSFGTSPKWLTLTVPHVLLVFMAHLVCFYGGLIMFQILFQCCVCFITFRLKLPTGVNITSSPVPRLTLIIIICTWELTSELCRWL